MDKYEYNLKLDQMKSLYAEEKYDEAADIADTINWNKIKNVNALVKAGEIYEKTQRYEDSRDVLLMAYDRSPIGRMIIYRLAAVAIKMQDYQAAQDYYDEFVEIAPHDTLKFVLRYDIQKAKGASYSDLIPILEELKDQEYTEEWAYELAYLYHKAGLSDKCIDACDELILWFGDGPFVERALELKMLYQPLTKIQEEKYRSYRRERENYEGAAEISHMDEPVHDPVDILKVDINPERYNTVNLQEEIAKGMQQIMEATEKETVTDTLDSINKIVEEIPYLQLPKEEEEETAETRKPYIETDEEIDGSLKLNFQEMLGEDSDGQISLMTDDHAQVEHQITGQITIEEVLDEWERTKRAAEAALEDAKQRKLESAKVRALQQAEDIMDRLEDVKPKLDAGVTPKELLEEKYMQDLADAAMAAENLYTAEPSIIEEPVPEPVIEETVLTEPGEPEITPISEESVQQEAPYIPEEIYMPEKSGIVSESAVGIEPEILVEPEAELESEILTEPEAVSESETPVEPEAVSNSETPVEFEAAAEPEIIDKSETPAGEKLSFEEAHEEEFAFVRNKPQDRSTWKEKTIRMPDITEPEDLGEETVPENDVPDMELTDEQKAVFSYFMPVKGMESQLCKALAGISERLKSKGYANRGNLIIQGSQGSGRTTLATSIIKVLQQETGYPDGKIGKIKAEVLNEKDLVKLLRKVSGGCLIIEQAGELNLQAELTLSLLMEQNDSGLLVILEDTSKGIKKLQAQDADFIQKFTEKISVPIFTNDELVTFARSYSRELGYKIDDMAVLALYNRISNIQRLDQATTLTEVKEIVDEAIEREAHGGLKKAFSILTANRYTDDDRIVLREKDFE